MVTPQHLTSAFVIVVLQQFFRDGNYQITVAEITIAAVAANSSLSELRSKPDSEWIQAVVKDLVDRGYLTILPSESRMKIVGLRSTSPHHIDWSKARLRIEPSIIHAKPTPDSPSLVNINHGEQFFGHASKFEENHYETIPAVAPVDAQSPATEDPKKLLFGWAEILNALNLLNDGTNHDRVSRLNDLHAGPIIKRGRGQPPTVDADKLIPWWNSLETLHAESVQQATDTKATVAASYQHGKEGEVVPDIAGHVQKQRKRN